eukprot:1522723-Rhodomonas_salina.1
MMLRVEAEDEDLLGTLLPMALRVCYVLSGAAVQSWRSVAKLEALTRRYQPPLYCPTHYCPTHVLCPLSGTGVVVRMLLPLCSGTDVGYAGTRSEMEGEQRGREHKEELEAMLLRHQVSTDLLPPYAYLHTAFCPSLRACAHPIWYCLRRCVPKSVLPRRRCLDRPVLTHVYGATKAEVSDWKFACMDQ